MSQNDEDFLFGAPTKEEDEPLDKSQLQQLDPVTAMKLQIDNNEKNAKIRNNYSAFKTHCRMSGYAWMYLYF